MKLKPKIVALAVVVPLAAQAQQNPAEQAARAAAQQERHFQRRRESRPRTRGQASRFAWLERFLFNPMGLLDGDAFRVHEHLLPADRRR